MQRQKMEPAKQPVCPYLRITDGFAGLLSIASSAAPCCLQDSVHFSYLTNSWIRICSPWLASPNSWMLCPYPQCI